MLYIITLKKIHFLVSTFITVFLNIKTAFSLSNNKDYQALRTKSILLHRNIWSLSS